MKAPAIVLLVWLTVWLLGVMGCGSPEPQAQRRCFNNIRIACREPSDCIISYVED